MKLCNDLLILKEAYLMQVLDPNSLYSSRVKMRMEMRIRKSIVDFVHELLIHILEEESSVLRQRVDDLESELTVALDTNSVLRGHVSLLKKQLKAIQIKYMELEDNDLPV